jgi:predicted transcriptional regulator
MYAHSMTVSEEDVKAVHLTLRIDERLVDELKRVAKENDRSLSAEARQAFRDYLRDRKAA